MNNYLSSEFTLKEYEKLILLAKKRFKFISYEDSKFDLANSLVIWRHDIDASLEQAVKLAEIEFRHRVCTTYFIHLHSTFYNALDPFTLNAIREILAYKHKIGLHFDSDYYNINNVEQLNYWLEFEKHILENLFQVDITAFSFHNPNKFSLQCEEEFYANMRNTYSASFKTQYHYCSDSNGYWRYKKLYDILIDNSISKLQVLTHPEWWTKEEITPREKIVKVLNDKANFTIKYYDDLLNNAGRLNIS